MVNIHTSPRLSRRAALALGLGATSTLALGACSNEGRGAGANNGGSSAGTGGGALQLPNSLPRPEIDGVVLSEIEGVPPAFTKLPHPGIESVPDVPGKGGEMSSFTITWGAPPKLAEDGNKWHQAINEALGVKLNPIIVPAQTFGDKLVTTIAGGDIPEITTNEPSYRGRGARKYLPQGVFHDLRNFLGGDKVEKYPNLALVPEYAWKNSVIGDAVYGVPCYRNQTVGGTIMYRQDWAEKGGFGDKPTNEAELKKWLAAIKKGGGEDSWATATLDQTLNFCGLNVQRSPNGWRVDGGKLVKDIETDEYEAGLAFAAQMWKDGLVHPDMLALTPNVPEYQGQFFAGRAGFCNTNLDGYFGTTGLIAKLQERDPKAKSEVLVPPGADGGVGMVPPDLGFYCMLSIPSSITDEDRIHEILSVMNYMAAPMGSSEYFLTHYGVEGHNYTIEGGAPVPSTDEDVRTESFLSMLSSFNLGFFFPGAEEDATTAQKIAEEMVSGFLPDPTTGLDSETSFSKGDALTSMQRDYEGGIVTGRRKLSEIEDMRKRWRDGGGEQIRTELSEQL